MNPISGVAEDEAKPKATEDSSKSDRRRVAKVLLAQGMEKKFHGGKGVCLF